MRLELYLRGKVYWCRGSESGLKFRKSTRERRERQADAIRRQWEKQLDDPDSFRAHQATVSSAAERWVMEIVVAKKSETVRFYRTKIAHVVRLLGGTRLSKLSKDHVLAFTQKREAEGAHTHTVHRELTALRLTLKSAQDAGEFPKDPRRVIPAYAARYVPMKDWVEADVIWAAIAHLPQRRGAAVAWAIATASDFSTIFNARRSDVRPHTVLVRGTKTGTRHREIPKVVVVEPFLRHALAYGEEGDLLFKPWGKMARDIRRACRRAGVQEFTARTMRRSIATWFVNAGVPYEIAAAFLGHANTLMLQKVYGKLAPSAAGRLIDERLQ